MTQFQNTIAYGTFYNDGGTFTFDAGNYTNFLFKANPQVVKNVSAYTSGANDPFQVQVHQTGIYWVEFSFMAGGGDGKTYYVQPYVNGNAYQTIANDMSIRFYQQPTEQKYEVSTHALLNLTEGDYFEYQLFSPASSPTVALTTKNIKLNVVNLQQMGIH